MFTHQTTKLRERSETRFQTYFEKEIGRLKNEYFKEAEVSIFFFLLLHTAELLAVFLPIYAKLFTFNCAVRVVCIVSYAYLFRM